MLWIEYESSEVITKDVIKDVVIINKLLYPTPVAAEDQKPDGFGIIAYDGYSDYSNPDESGNIEEPNPPELMEHPKSGVSTSEMIENLDISFQTTAWENSDFDDTSASVSSSNDPSPSQNCEHCEAITHSKIEQSGGHHSTSKIQSKEGNGDGSNGGQKAG